ncbi:MAG: ABC transporter permease [Ignavibacteria bacterium]|nr:ABC transporter permease [Ignavibacteria bacterium]
MTSPEFFIAKRYLFSKKKFNFITVISLISVLGVTVGVAALIIVLSVFNGFSSKVTGMLINFDPHLRVEASGEGNVAEYKQLESRIRDLGYENASVYTMNKGMLATNRSNEVVVIKGVEPDGVSSVSGIRDIVRFGEFDLSDEGGIGGVVIGFSLLNKLKSMPGDTITILSPLGLEKSLTQFVDPKSAQFVIKGVYDSDNKEYDGNFAFISLAKSQELFNLGSKVNGIELRIPDISNSQNVKEKLIENLGSGFSVQTWYDLHADFYSILKVERITVYLILSLIIAVASFNILGSLTMTVIEKKRDIGVLKAIGATDGMITKIFLYEGISVGIIGMLAGTAIGILVTLGQKYFEFYKLDPLTYKIDALPVEMRIIDLILVPLAALLLCFLASLYPSRRAAALEPVSAIRWE